MADNNFLMPQAKPEATLAKKLPCPFSPAGMLQPSHLQPPPMFGPRGNSVQILSLPPISDFLPFVGPTIPPKHLAPYAHFKINRSHTRPPRPTVHNNQQFRSKDSVQRNSNNFDKKNHTRRPEQQHHHKTRSEFWCEPCDRDFRSEDQLQEHQSQHQKCGIDGCKFVGHELIVSKHIQMQHSTGLYERLKNLNTPEDILKWREERKKRYPTKANIELRQQMQEERTKRGEKLTNSNNRFGRNSDRRRCNKTSTNGNRVGEKTATGKPNTSREGKKKRRRTRKTTVTAVGPLPEENDKSKIVSTTGLPMFHGTSQMKNYKKRREVQPKNALSSLLGAYESDSDSNESFSECTSSSEETEDALNTSSEIESVEKLCSEEAFLTSADISETPVMEGDRTDLLSGEPMEMEEVCNDSDELPNEEPIVKMEEFVEPIPSKGVTKVVKNNRTTGKALDKRLSKRPTVMDLSKKYRNQNTMLEKLLQNEIRHERNILLQCVRHVVKENFFGIGSKTVE